MIARSTPLLPSSARLELGAGGLERVVVDAPAAQGAMYLHGAHITAWQPRGHDPVIWLSPASAFAADAPIRGGVPICFPWFGAHATDTQAPAHGFARLQSWTLQSAEEHDGAVTIGLRLANTANHPISAAWPHQFEASYLVTFGESLEMRLQIGNPGKAAVTFEEALHTYYAVSDIRNVTVTGLEGTEYLDKVGEPARRAQGHDAIRFTRETDRIYLDTRATCAIHDPGRHRDIQIGKTHSDTTVVWNPWIEKTARLKDLPPDGWTEMLCVETCNVGPHAVTLGPGGTHVMTAMVTVTR